MYVLWMKWKRLWELNRGPVRIGVDVATGEPAPPEYPIARTTWKRAIRLVRQFGSQRARELIDERAWRAFNRGDDDTSRRWRDLIIAIHAMEEDELLPGEHVQ